VGAPLRRLRAPARPPSCRDRRARRRGVPAVRGPGEALTLAAGLVLAGLSALALNWGYVAQHGEAAKLPPLAIRRPLRSLRLLFGRPRWLAGFLVGILGWVLYVAALRVAPLSLVQAASAGGLGVLALLVSRTARLSRREWRGVALAVAGLVLLGLSLAGGNGAGGRGSVLAIAVWIAVSALVAGGAAAAVRDVLVPGAGFGVAAGLLYAAGDVGTKAAVFGGSRLGFVPVLLACHGLAFVALQLGFQRGAALPTIGLATLLTNAVPIAAGMLLFGEPLPGGVLGALRLAAFAAAVAGAALIAAPRGEGAPAPVPTYAD
jgi:hypothetical protein